MDNLATIQARTFAASDAYLHLRDGGALGVASFNLSLCVSSLSPKARTRSLCPLSRSPRSPSQPAQRATRSASRAGRSLAPARANSNARARCLNLFAFSLSVRPSSSSFVLSFPPVVLRVPPSAQRRSAVYLPPLSVSLVCVREQGMGRVAAAASSAAAAAAAAAAACASVCVCAYSQEEEGGGI